METLRLVVVLFLLVTILVIVEGWPLFMTEAAPAGAASVFWSCDPLLQLSLRGACFSKKR